jgi:hypothetical protein
MQTKVRVIRDVRDARRDYWISSEEAKKLFEEGHLIQVHANGDNWDYAHKRR